MGRLGVSHNARPLHLPSLETKTKNGFFSRIVTSDPSDRPPTSNYNINRLYTVFTQFPRDASFEYVGVCRSFQGTTSAVPRASIDNLSTEHRAQDQPVKRMRGHALL